MDLTAQKGRRPSTRSTRGEGFLKKHWQRLLLGLVYPVEMELYPSKKNSLAVFSRPFRRQATPAKTDGGTPGTSCG